MPADFPQRATMPARALAEHYGVCYKTIARWRRNVGVSIPAGAPRGNRNYMGADGRTPRKRGSDDPAAIRTCLSCTRTRCPGRCDKVH